MKKAAIILFLSLLLSCAFAAQDTVYNASKFGIRSDGITMNTRPIQKGAILVGSTNPYDYDKVASC